MNRVKERIWKHKRIWIVSKSVYGTITEWIQRAYIKTNSRVKERTLNHRQNCTHRSIRRAYMSRVKERILNHKRIWVKSKSVYWNHKQIILASYIYIYMYFAVTNHLPRTNSNSSSMVMARVQHLMYLRKSFNPLDRLSIVIWLTLG